MDKGYRQTQYILLLLIYQLFSCWSYSVYFVEVTSEAGLILLIDLSSILYFYKYSYFILRQRLSNFGVTLGVIKVTIRRLFFKVFLRIINVFIIISTNSPFYIQEGWREVIIDLFTSVSGWGQYWRKGKMSTRRESLSTAYTCNVTTVFLLQSSFIVSIGVAYNVIVRLGTFGRRY